MQLSDSRLINAPREVVFAALNDPEILRQCIIGCDSLTRQDDGALAAAMSVRVGPVSAKFSGTLRLEDVVSPERYTLKFEGNGGAAGFATGSAKVNLTPEGSATRLAYESEAQIGGKLAQVGSRLVDAAAKKIAEDFFGKFSELVGQPMDADGSMTSSASEGKSLGDGDSKPGKSAIPTWAWGAGLAALVAILYAVSRT